MPESKEAESHGMSCTINILEDGFSPENQAKTDAYFRERGAQCARERDEAFFKAFMGDDYESPEAFEKRMQERREQQEANSRVNAPYGIVGD